MAETVTASEMDVFNNVRIGNINGPYKELFNLYQLPKSVT